MDTLPIITLHDPSHFSPNLLLALETHGLTIPLLMIPPTSEIRSMEMKIPHWAANKHLKFSLQVAHPHGEYHFVTTITGWNPILLRPNISQIDASPPAHPGLKISLPFRARGVFTNTSSGPQLSFTGLGEGVVFEVTRRFFLNEAGRKALAKHRVDNIRRTYCVPVVLFLIVCFVPSVVNVRFPFHKALDTELTFAYVE